MPKLHDAGAKLSIPLTLGETEAIDTLVDTGLFGQSRTQCAQRLIARALIQLAEDGWLPQPCDDDDDDDDDD